MVLCTVVDPEQAIAEIRRVLRPGGRLLFVEHVRAESRRLARWQDRLNGPWCAFADGCNANRPTRDLLQAGGLQVENLDRAKWRGMPVIVHPLAFGTAVA
jgi:SAM-dependent methyltransferase